MVSAVNKLNPFNPAQAMQAQQPINPTKAVTRQPYNEPFAGQTQKSNLFAGNTGIIESMNNKPVNTPSQAGIPAGVAGEKLNLIG